MTPFRTTVLLLSATPTWWNRALLLVATVLLPVAAPAQLPPMPNGTNVTDGTNDTTNQVVQVGFGAPFTGWLAVCTNDSPEAAWTVLSLAGASIVTLTNLPLLPRWYLFTWALGTNKVLTQYSRTTWSGNQVLTSFFLQSSPDLKAWTNVWSVNYTGAPPGRTGFFRLGWNKRTVAMP